MPLFIESNPAVFNFVIEPEYPRGTYLQYDQFLVMSHPIVIGFEFFATDARKNNKAKNKVAVNPWPPFWKLKQLLSN